MKLVEKFFSSKFIEKSVYFKIAFIYWSLLHAMTLGQYITSYMSPIFIVWGCLIIFKNIFINKSKFYKKYYLLSFMFLFSYVITILINRNMNFIGNIKTFIWTSILLLGLFITDFEKEKQDIMEDIYKLSIAIIIGSLIISLISLLLFFFEITFWTNRVDGTRIPQGYYAARLWGIYVDPNQSCNVAIISIAVSLVLLIICYSIKKPKLILNILSIFNILVQFELIVLSGSRGGEIGLIFFLMGLLYIFIEAKLFNKLSVKNLRVFLSLILALIISVSIIMTFKWNRRLLTYVPATIQNSNEDSEEKTTITTERPDTKSSNGRIELWTDALKLSKHISIFGVGDRNIMLVAQEKLPGSSITHQYVHNGYLHMLLGGGIVALIIMLILICSIGTTSFLKIVNKNKFNNEYLIFVIMSFMILSMLVTTIFLTEVFYQNSFTAIIIWIFMGYIVYLHEKEEFTRN